MQKKTLVILLTILLLICSIAGAVDYKDRPVNIGMIVDGPWEINDQFLNQFKKEILDLTAGEFDIRFPVDKTIVGDWSVESIDEGLDRLLADKEVDIIITGGVLASHLASGKGDLPKPVIAPFIIDEIAQDIPAQKGHSAIKNLSYIAPPDHLVGELQAFHEIYPFEKLLIIVNEPFYDLVKNNKSARVRKWFESINAGFNFIPSGKTVEDVLASIPEGTDAVYFGFLPQFDDTEFRRLMDGFISRKLPTFSLMGEMDIRRGAMAALTSNKYYNRISRRTALNIQSILLGEKPENIPVNISRFERLIINMSTARSINKYPSWSILTEAQLIDVSREDIERVVTIESAVDEAIRSNRDLLASSKDVEAAGQNRIKARANLLPQLEVSALGTLIDEDRAEASLGSATEESIAGTASASMLIFSEPAWANYSIQGNLQKSREYEHQKYVLDITLETVTTYLDLLKAKTYERIQGDNLKRTRSNYELAKIRQSIGASGPGEVYRWENQIATSRNSVIEANAYRNLAEIALNRILNRPSEEQFTISDISLNNPELFIADRRFVQYLENPWSFKVFREFMVEESQNNSMELAAINAALEARKRALYSSRNSMWMPTLALKADYTEQLHEGGAGTNGASALPFDLPKADDTNWSLAINASLPIFSGGAKISNMIQKSDELKMLEYQRESVVEKVEQRIRSALHLMGASYAAIHQTRMASEAADKTLDLVLDAYSRGEASILDLIDAQNASLVSSLLAANAVYDFLDDYMNVQRAVGKFDLTMQDKDKEDFLNRLDQRYDELSNDN